MTQNQTRYVVFARPKDPLIVEDFQNIASFTALELLDYLKVNKDEEFLAIHTPYFLEALDPSSHPFEEYLNIIRDSKPESRYSRPDYYIEILPLSESANKDFTIYVDVELLNTLDNSEKEELIIPPFPVQVNTANVASYDDLKKVILSKFPFGVEVGETPKFSIQIPKDDDPNGAYQEFDLSDENPHPSISDFLDSYLHKNRIKVKSAITKKSLTEIRHRVKILKEIKSTEETFINGLHDLLNYYQTKFRDAKLLSSEEDKKVFNNIPLILNAHETLLKQLDGAKQTYSSNVSSLFIDFSNYFKVSKLYISQYSAIIQMFLDKNKEKEFARKFQEISKGHVELNSLLITPVQRMPRYILFLRELIKFTPPSHPDASLLKTAEKFLQEVTLDIEKASSEAENQAVTATVQDKIGKDQLVILKADRVYIFSAKIEFIKPKLGKGTVYLFNDLILFITEKESNELPSSNGLIVLAQTPTEFKYSVSSVDTITFLIDGNPISHAVRHGNKGKTEKEKKKEEEKREKERKKQKVAIVQIDDSDKEKLLNELHMSKVKYYKNQQDDKKNYFKFVALNLKKANLDNDIFVYDMDGAYDQDKQIMYIFGGYPLNSNLLIINVFNGAVMTMPLKIPPRMNHSVTLYTKAEQTGFAKYLLIFGGKGEGNEVYNDFWQIDLKKNYECKQLNTRTTIEPRYGHTAVIYGDRLCIFGGMNKKKVLNDLCIVSLNESTLIWQTQQAAANFPSPRAFHSSTIIKDKWYIFGGINDKKANILSSKVSDEKANLHVLDFNTFSWEVIDLQNVTNRAWHRIVAVGSYIIIIGGIKELEVEPIVVYDTEFGKISSYFPNLNYPIFLSGFYCSFVSQAVNVAPTSSITGSLTRLNTEEGEITQGIKRTSQPHLLVFGGVNPVIKEALGGLYEVKLPPSLRTEANRKNELTATARNKRPNKERKPDSIPIGSPMLSINTNPNDDDDENSALILNINKRSTTTMGANSQAVKDFRNKLLNNTDKDMSTNLESIAEMTAIAAAEIAKKRESSRRPSIPHPSSKNNEDQQNAKPEDAEQPIPPSDQEQPVNPEPEPPKSEQEQPASEEPPKPEPQPEPEPPKPAEEPSKPEPEPAPAPEPAPPKPTEVPSKPEDDIPKPAPVEPNPNVSSGFAARLAMFGGASPAINHRPPPSTPSSTPTKAPEPEAATPAISIDTSGDFDEDTFCNSIGVDPSSLLAYQRKLLTNKLKSLYDLKKENENMEKTIAEAEETKEAVISHETFKYYGKVIINKKYVKLVQLNSDCSIEQIKDQIKEACSGSITDSMNMFATNKPLDSNAVATAKETTQGELTLMLSSLSDKNSSHINFCFQ